MIGNIYAPWFTIVSLWKIRHYSSQRRWTLPERLQASSLEHRFHDQNGGFKLELPIMMPKGYYLDLPAISKWFTAISTDSSAALLDHSYLGQLEDALVLLEYTRLSENAAEALTFHRAEAPLGIFLQWARDAKANTTERLYLAQASLTTLPPKLQDDLPIPALVTRLGKGDIYDANIWMGIPPTYTPLHQDPNPNLLVQLAGRKTVRLLAPSIGQRLFDGVQASLGQKASCTFRGEEMMKGEEKVVLEACVWDDTARQASSNVDGYEVHLERGDGLYIPVGWWHSVKGVGNGVTASVCIGIETMWFLSTNPDHAGQLVVPLNLLLASH